MLVTGANGFVGRALCAEAVSRGMAVRGITRASGYLPISVEKFAVDGIDGNTDWQDVLTGCEVVVHLAARVHVMVPMGCVAFPKLIAAFVSACSKSL